MRRIFLSLAAIAAASSAAPSSAQYSAGQDPSINPYPNDNISERIAQLESRLEEGVESGSIDRREARSIGEDLRTVSYLEADFRWRGFSRAERANLDRRIQRIRRELEQADDGAHGRYAEWDREDPYAWDFREDDRVDANNDGWDDRDHNRNGSWYDDPQRPGTGGLVDNALRGGGLQVGQRVSASLYEVPYPYQAQYRDGNGVYYRSDGRQIYQIDGRRHTVKRVFRI